MLQLVDICKAPLDGVYEALKERNALELKEMVHNNYQVVQTNDPFAVRKYGGVLRTLRPLENAIQFRGRNGDLKEIRGASSAFENVPSLNIKELMVDFDVGISGIRRRQEDGKLVVNASIPCNTARDAITGGIHFNVVYKNELPSGLAKMHEIYTDMIKDQYLAIRDGEDIKTEDMLNKRVDMDKRITWIEDTARNYSNMFFEVDGVDHSLVVHDLIALQQTMAKFVEEFKDDDVSMRRILDVAKKFVTLDDLLDRGIVVETDDTAGLGILEVFKVGQGDRHLLTSMITMEADGTWKDDVPTDAKSYKAA